MFYESKLENGIRIIGQKLPHFRSVSMGVWMATGSVKERADEGGISHFIEHMLFKGTDSRSAQKIAADMDEIGAQMNAFTGKECTCFYAKAVDEHMDRVAEILSDMVNHSAFDPTEMEKEKGVVCEEISMVEDSPEDVAMELLSAAYFGDCPLGKPILGTKESVRSFSREGILDYMDRHYTAENTIVAVAGNFDENALYDCVNHWFGAEKTPVPPEAYPVPPEIRGVKTASREKDIEQCHISLAIPAYSPKAPEYYTMLILNNAIGGSMSSRLFQRIREERGLAYSVYSFNSSYKETGVLGFYAGTGASQAKDVLKLILDEIDSAGNHGITAEEFKRSRDQMKGSYILANESVGARMSAIGKSRLLYDSLKTEEQVIKDIEAVTPEAVNELAKKLFVTDNMTATFVGKEMGLEDEVRRLLSK